MCEYIQICGEGVFHSNIVTDGRVDIGGSDGIGVGVRL